MPVNSYSFIEEAERTLSSGSSEEITFRNVVSRSYYGVYHCALMYADTINVPPLSACGGSSHKKISDFYKDFISKDRNETLKFRKIGIKLLQLHGQRIKSDYLVSETVYQQDAESALISAKALSGDLVAIGAVA